MARWDESVWSNDDVRKFNTNTKVQGMMTYELQVSIKLRKYRTQKTAMARRSEERPSTAAADGFKLTASNSRSRTVGTEPLGLRALYASHATTAAQTAKRLNMRTKVGSSSTEGCIQEPGHTLQYSCFDMASCVKDATWNPLTRLCCRDDNVVQ
jgi:hypothetical protein